MKNERILTRGRAPVLSGLAVLCAAAVASGCSPTYGTGKSANQQLLEDVSNVFSVAPRTSGVTEAAYRPRHQLVRPASVSTLPEPQDEIASAENPAWPESPEQRRARIRAEATENQDNTRYRPAVRYGGTAGGVAEPYPNQGIPDVNPAAQRAEFQARLRESRQGEATTRRYLSEPPLDYRQPADTAPTDELGEDERTKERRLRQAAGKSSWRDYLPW